MAFCSKCGNSLEDNAEFCSKCGQRVATAVGQQPQPAGYQQPAQQAYQQPVYTQPQPNLIDKLRGKIQTEAIVWIVIASLQVIIAIWYIITGIELSDHYYSDGEGTANIISGLIILAVAISNYVFSSKDMKYAKQIMTSPVGIVEKYRPVGGIVGMMIWNLLMGGIIGVVGSVFCFLTRNFVVSNEAYFRSIEAQYTNH